MVDKSEKFRWAIRVGYFSRAILYTVLGLIALTSVGQISKGTDGIFRAIENFPLGEAILWIMVVGLTAYGFFRLASFAFDIENQGSDKIGWGKRMGHAGSAICHFALAYSAWQFAGRNSAGAGSGNTAQDAAAGVLSIEFGSVVLGILAIAFFLAAINQAKKGLTGSFMNRIAGNAPAQTRLLGGVGYCARAVVFGVIGWSVFKAAFLSGGPNQIKTLGDAVASLAGQGFVFNLVAVGLLIFGLFSLILARYRIIPDMGSSGRVPAFRA